MGHRAASIQREMSVLASVLDQALSAGQLLESSRKNIELLLRGSASPLAEAAITELANAGQWEVLLSMRNTLRDQRFGMSLLDELLAVSTPTRVVGGVQVKF